MVECSLAYLMVGEDERVGNDHVLPTSRSEDDDLANVLGSEGVDTSEHRHVSIISNVQKQDEEEHEEETTYS